MWDPFWWTVLYLCVAYVFFLYLEKVAERRTFD